MKTGIRLCISMYIVVLAVITANLVFGEHGIISYFDLSEYKNEIEYNIQELKKLNENLMITSERLITEPEEIRLQARKLGWLEENESIIIVRGIKYEKPGYVMGKLLSYEKSIFTVDCRNFTVFSIVAGFIFYILSGFYLQTKTRKRI